MAMQDKVLINSIDVTDYRITWNFSGEWDTAIDSLTITLAASVSSLLTLSPALDIKITRGFVTDTDETVFIGQITQVKPRVDKVTLICKNPLVDAVKSAQTKSWDKDIDTEAGVGSEIFKSICDNSSLSYNYYSIINTGNTDPFKIVKFIQNDEDDFQKMNELAEHYNYIIGYDYENELTEFKPKGFTIYPKDLTVGEDIPGQIKWKENMEQLINKVKIQGATVYDKIPESFAGPGTEFTLSKTPEDTEVHINAATTNDIQTRGQKDVGILGTDFDYYVDVEQKKIIFGSSVSDVTVVYGAQVPLPIILKDPVSIDTYGGPNKVPSFKRFEYPDIKDVKDAEDRGRAILSKYATPFLEAEKIPIKNDVLQTYGNFKPGDVVRIIDPFTDKDVSVFVSEVIKAWPHVNDKITIGDEIWRTEDWQARQMKKINQLFNELNKNQDILIQTVDLTRTLKLRRRYSLAQKKDRSSDGTDTFILGHAVYGILGTQKLGDKGTALVDYCLIPGNNIYKEYVYDTTFYDSVNSTGTTWDTSGQDITITSGNVCYTNAVALGYAYTHFTLYLASATNTYTIEVSADGKSTWQTVTQNVRTAFTSSDGTGIYVRITNTGAPDVVISNAYLGSGLYNSPAIYLKLE